MTVPMAGRASIPRFPVPPLARRIFDIAEALDSEARIVGGVVRDWVLDARSSALAQSDGPPSPHARSGDIDMSIACPIARAVDALRDAGLKIVETGLVHGTVTVIADGQTIELTQTRIDLDTDGRHAVIGFTDDWAEDARRRDFTVNALYITADGMLEDPLGGLADLAAGRLRFVGNAKTRITEDALRMLRYCRFLPRFGQTGIDDEALAAIGAMAAQAAHLSGERVAHECRRLFAAQAPLAGVRVMHESGLDEHALGLRLQPHLLKNLPPFDVLQQAFAATAASVWLLPFAVVLPAGAANTDAVIKRLRLSRAESRFLTSLDKHGSYIAEQGLAGESLADGDVPDRGLAGKDWHRPAWFLRRDGHDPAAIYLVQTARGGTPVSAGRLLDIAAWQPPQCPVTATDLLSHGVDKGPALGDMLCAIEHRWVMHDFTLTRAELLAAI